MGDAWVVVLGRPLPSVAHSGVAPLPHIAAALALLCALHCVKPMRPLRQKASLRVVGRPVNGCGSHPGAAARAQQLARSAEATFTGAACSTSQVVCILKCRVLLC